MQLQLAATLLALSLSTVDSSSSSSSSSSSLPTLRSAFVAPCRQRQMPQRRPLSPPLPLQQQLLLARGSAADTDAAFSAFAESLDEESLFSDDEDDDNDDGRGRKSPDKKKSGTNVGRDYDMGDDDQEGAMSWQESLEQLLDPTTPLTKRQILLSDLVNSNKDIRDSVQVALRERTIDPLLTPTGKKLQDGTRAVARQIASDIIPSIASTISIASPAAVVGGAVDAGLGGSSSSSSSGGGIEGTNGSARRRRTNGTGNAGGGGGGGGGGGNINNNNNNIGGMGLNRQSSTSTRGMSDIASELPTLVPKLGSRIIDATIKQARRQLELLQGDLADPSRIPARITERAAIVAAEARNVFAETPLNLVGPAYKVVMKGNGYEIRDYDGYDVASTSMAKAGEAHSMDDVAGGGAAFNALAAYLFGANDEGKTMDMTTPVAITSLGEMRFYLKKDDETKGIASRPPRPLNDEDDRYNERGAVEIKHIPSARLAVSRFTGFVTDGEVARQKDALLTALAADGVEVDVPHGQVVPHVVFQYNPPYTIPIVRRNEIAIPVDAGRIVGASRERRGGGGGGGKGNRVGSDNGNGGRGGAVANSDGYLDKPIAAFEREWEDAIGGIDAGGKNESKLNDEVDHGGPDSDDVGPSDY